MSQKCYEIKDWHKHFENSESRRYKSLAWVPVKNKHDGKGYRRVCQHPKSVQVFCAWSLMIQVASKMPTRGLLRDEDGPLTALDLADMTGFPTLIFEVAFEALLDPKVGWIVESTQQLPQMPADAQQNPVNRTEQNRTEKGGRESHQVLSMSEKISCEKELARVGDELKTAGLLSDYAKGSKKHGRIIELRDRQTELRSLLGVTA